MSLVSNFLGTVRRVQFIQNDKTVIEVDASVKEVHSRESKATTFPVEDGTSISDDIILSPFKLQLTGVISDSALSFGRGLLTTAVASLVPGPLGVIGQAIGGELVSTILGSQSPSVAAYEALLKLQAKKQPFDVFTTLKRYSNMWITNLSVPREAASGNALEFDIGLDQLIIVSPQSVNIQIFSNADLSASEQNLGKQETNSALVDQFKKGQADFTKLVH